MTVKVKCYFPIGTLLFATKNIQDSSGNWKGVIAEGGISSISRSIGQEKSYEVSSVSITFSDMDKYFRRMMAGENQFIAGKRVELLDEDDALIYAGTVNGVEYGHGTFTLSVDDKLSGFQQVLTEAMLKKNYKNITAEADGKAIPIIYGHIFSEFGNIKAWRVDTNKFILAHHHCYSLEEAYLEDETEVTTNCTLDNNEDGMAYINFVSSADFIYVNVKGKMNSELELIVDPIEVFKDVIESFSDSTYDADAALVSQEVMQERGYYCAGAITTMMTMEDFLTEICETFDSDYYLNNNSDIVIKTINLFDLNPEKNYAEAQIVSFSIKQYADDIKNSIRYLYQYNYGKDYYFYQPFYKDETSVALRGEFYSGQPLHLKWTSGSLVAFDVVQRFIHRYQAPPKIANITLNLRDYIGMDIGSVIRVTHSDAITVGPIEYMIDRAELNHEGNTATITAIDISTFSGGVFIVGDETMDPDWPTASPQSRRFGYLCDPSGYFPGGVDPGKVWG